MFIFNAAFAADSPNIFKPHGSGFFPLEIAMDYLDDPSGSFNVKQVASGQAGEFKLLEKKNYQFSYKHRALWIRFVVDFSNYDEFYWFLVQNYEHVSELTVFYSDASGEFHSNSLIENIAPGKRTFKIHQYLFKLPVLLKKPTTYYVRYVPDGHALNIDLSWADPKGIIESVSNTQIGLGLFFGGLVVMWIYNFFLYFFLRDKTYLYYLYYLGTFIFTYFYITGLASLVVRYNDFVQQFFAACAYASVHGMILFARQFLNLRASVRWLNSYLVVCQWLLFFGIIACFFLPASTTFDKINYVIFFVVPALVLGGGIRVHQRYQPAYLYFTGWTVLGIGLFLQALRSTDVVPSNFITNYAIQIAAVLEAIIFGLALANRIRLLEREELKKSNLLLAQLEKSIATEREAVKQKTLFIAAVNHELRTPLQTLTGSIEVLVHMAKSTSMEKFVGRISRASQQITAQMRDIGEYSRLEAGVLDQRNKEFNLTELLSGVIDDFSKTAQTKNISLVLMNEIGDREIMGDADRIRQILSNLVYNAIKFTEKGSVTIHADLVKNTSQTSSEKLFTLNLKITDTGIGIAESNLPKIFDAFTSVGIETENRGTGLGLAIVKRIVKLLHAEINVTSMVGAGTEFIVSIPVNAANQKGVFDG